MGTHIFGMAKSSANLNGAKRQKLELDVLRIIRAIQYTESKRKGEKAKGYVLVFTEKIRDTVIGWLNKYDFNKDKICIIVYTGDSKTRSDIEKEKKRNVEGITGQNKHSAIADISKKSTELYLEKQINEKEGIKDYEPFIFKQGANFPLTINWDYYFQKLN